MNIKLNDGNFITDDSKACESGCYFLCSNSNEKYKDEALKKGANLIRAKAAIEMLNLKNSLKLIGITGTNGKTTTAAIIYETLLNLGFKAGVSGTRGAFINKKQIAKKALTTSQICQTLSYLKAAKDENCDFFIMEVSSHAIAQNRIEGLEFDLKIFTNLSQDHLDFHKTFEEYAKVKSSFFDDDSLKIINKDDKFIKFNPHNSHTYSLLEKADFFPVSYELENGIKADLVALGNRFEISSYLQGKFNLYNLLAAFGALKLMSDKSDYEIASAMAKFRGVAGRVEVVSQNPLVIVDFAHTPDGIEKVLSSLNQNELIVVFGAGGDRDKTKRPLMGKIVQKYAKTAIVTSDNPRSENQGEIIEDILQGMDINNAVLSQADRKEAINLALNLATNNQTIVILGKGDEDYQEINGIKYPFSDKAVVQEILSKKS